MITLDLQTVFVCCAVFMTVAVGDLLLLWLQNRRDHPETLAWLSAAVMFMLGLVLVAQRDAAPALVSTILADSLVVGGMLVLYVGLAQHLEIAVPQVQNYVMFGVFVALYVYLTYVAPSTALRDATQSAATVFLSAQAAWILLRRARPEFRGSARPLGIAYAVVTVMQSIVCVMSITHATATGIFIRGVLGGSVVLLQVTILCTLLLMSSLLLNRRLLIAAEAEVIERRTAEEELRIVIDNMPDSILITSLSQGEILKANESFLRKIGRSADDAIGQTTLGIGLWANPADRPGYIETVEREHRVSGYAANLCGAEGMFPAALYGEVIELGGQHCVLTVVHDETNHQLAQARLKELAELDPLTGLLNRAAFREKAIALARARVTGVFSLIYFDMDGLKDINDRLGHSVGDLALTRFAQALRTVCRSSDVIGRLGGDEYAVAAVSEDGTDTVALLARIHALLDEVERTERLPYSIGASAGVYEWDLAQGAIDIEAAIALADTRMYEAKRRRKGA